ncbi:probable glycosyltransferase At5g03795 [Pistacia vera]|uniref:probable glycosyltransferase At5g03795 n=1 Tax=Pistacia vera TaxID=55513 RepID=UPI0012637F47|nr:probable glycosyltransferase At5g03795 [Pistacia vera]
MIPSFQTISQSLPPRLRPTFFLGVPVFSLIYLLLYFLSGNSKSPQLGWCKSSDIYGEIFHSPEAFKLDYEQMEREFKVFVYPDGDPNTYYQTPRKLSGKYASEGYFFQNIRESQFLTNDPNSANLFFIPISCHKMRGKGVSSGNMTTIVTEYVESLISKYPFWNRTQGADHFFVTCHDIGVKATEGLPQLIKNSIRVVCSSQYDSGYIPHKDVSLPQILQPFALQDSNIGLKDRSILAFWAGYRNSKVRKQLVHKWQNDKELDIQNNHIDKKNAIMVYRTKIYRSKFCICPRGSQVNSVRIADSIHYGCVPVILSDNYDLPFNDILDWNKFSLILKEDDVPRLKKLLKGLSNTQQFIKLHENTVKARKHFQWNTPPIKYDAFHMVMYDLWLCRHAVKYQIF